jgi:hypothetical protein
VIADRREDRQLRRDGLQHDLEPHLVVARRSAAVGDGIGAELRCELREVFRLQAALGADRQRVHVAAPHVAHDQILDDAVEELRPRFDEAVIDGAKRPRALVERTGGGRIDAAAIDGHRHDGPVVSLLEPRHAERRVEAAREREDDGVTS